MKAKKAYLKTVTGDRKVNLKEVSDLGYPGDRDARGLQIRKKETSPNTRYSIIKRLTRRTVPINRMLLSHDQFS